MKWKEKLGMLAMTPSIHLIMQYCRHVALDCSHLEKREQLLQEETARRAVTFISKKEELSMEFGEVEVLSGPVARR